jgi:hydroxyethylthiazole kinase-like uncharacterized protein yjeF
MEGVWPVTEIRAAEQRVLAHMVTGTSAGATDSRATTGAAAGPLMAHAARAIAVEARAMLGFSYGARVLLLVGPGDNGGDALYAGAELTRRGMAVWAVLASPDRSHSGGLNSFRRAGGRLVRSDSQFARDLASRLDLIIDGLLGIGAKGPLRQSLVPLAALANSSPAPVLAIDIPSGVDPDTGVTAGVAISAVVTLCMGALKAGLLVGDGRRLSGVIRVVDIGLQDELPEPSIVRLTESDVTSLLRPPTSADNKYSRGVVGIAAGSPTYPGAAQLTVGSALLGGVGAVRYSGQAAAAVVDRWPEVLVSDTPGNAGRVQCWVVGPGLGRSEEAVKSLEYVLGTDVPVVIDADGLNLLANRSDLLELVHRRAAVTVLTPHDGEFGRLFGEVTEDRISVVRHAAKSSGAIVLLKGHSTLIAQPTGRCFINPTGDPALATAGSGDVLAGLIGSLIASGVEPSAGTALGAYLHGAAGAVAASDGPVVAMDLLPALRSLLNVRNHGPREY